MAYIIPTLEDFRERFPEFSDVSSEAIDLALEDAAMYVSREWSERAYPLAILFLAAHFIHMGLIATEGDVSELIGRLRSISYGPMNASFAMGQQARSTIVSDGDITSSVYLERFRTLMPPFSPIVLEGNTYGM